MKILFDQGTPAPLRRHLPQHAVTTVYEHGWSEMANGALLDAAAATGFDLFITTDQNLRYQQNLAGRHIAIVVLRSTSWPRIKQCVGVISDTIATMKPGDYREIEIAS